MFTFSYFYLRSALAFKRCKRNQIWKERPERPDSGGLCWLLKLRQMGTQRVQMKGHFLGWYVGTLQVRCRYTKFLYCLLQHIPLAKRMHRRNQRKAYKTYVEGPVQPNTPAYTANEGPLGIQHKCLVPIYVFPEMKLLFPKRNYNVLSPSPTLIYLWEIYIFPGSVCLFCCRIFCGPILGIYV